MWALNLLFGLCPPPAPHIGEADRMTVGKPPAHHKPSLMYDLTPRRIALAVVQADSNITNTWILQALATLAVLGLECSKVWGVTLDFLHENVLQPFNKPLYFFDHKLFPYGQQSGIILFAVNLKPIPRFQQAPIRVRPDDEVTMISLFNVTRSLQINYIVKTFATTWSLAQMAAFEWQHTCDLLLKNECLSSSKHIHQLVDCTSSYQAPVLVYESHPLALGDRMFKTPITTRHFPIIHPRRHRHDRHEYRTAPPPPKEPQRMPGHPGRVFSTSTNAPPAVPPPTPRPAAFEGFAERQPQDQTPVSKTPVTPKRRSLSTAAPGKTVIPPQPSMSNRTFLGPPPSNTGMFRPQDGFLPGRTS